MTGSDRAAVETGLSAVLLCCGSSLSLCPLSLHTSSAKHREMIIASYS